MKRKLIKQGSGGHTIYLPKKWVDSRGLGPGDAVNLESSGSALIITTDKPGAPKEVTIRSTSPVHSALRTQVTNAYRAGYDRVTIHFENKKQFEKLREVIQTRLIGFEIVKQEKNEIIVENITEPSGDQFQTIMRKLFFTVTETFETTKRHMQGEEVDYYSSAVRMQRYDAFCRRVLAKEMLVQPRSELLWTFLAILTHAQRELYHLNKLIKKPVSRNIIAFLEEIEEIFHLIEKSYIKKDVVPLEVVHDEYTPLYYERGYTLLESVKGKEKIIVLHLMAALRQFYLTNSPLLGWML